LEEVQTRPQEFTCVDNLKFLADLALAQSEVLTALNSTNHRSGVHCLPPELALQELGNTAAKRGFELP